LDTGGWAGCAEEQQNQRTMGIRGVQLEANNLYAEKRRVPRYPFIASAELIEIKADVRIASRVSELSLHGCYLDMMNPFPTGTLVLVKISAGDAFFEAKSQIAYSQPNMGAGVKFLEVQAQYQPVLERWLDEAAREQKPSG
jgi:PilZ domain